MDPVALILLVLVIGLVTAVAVLATLLFTGGSESRSDLAAKRRERELAELNKPAPLSEPKPEPVKPKAKTKIKTEPSGIMVAEEEAHPEISRWAGGIGSVLVVAGVALFAFVFGAELYEALQGIVAIAVRAGIVTLWMAAWEWKIEWNLLDEIGKGNPAAIGWAVGLLLSGSIIATAATT